MNRRESIKNISLLTLAGMGLPNLSAIAAELKKFMMIMTKQINTLKRPWIGYAQFSKLILKRYIQ